MSFTAFLEIDSPAMRTGTGTHACSRTHTHTQHTRTSAWEGCEEWCSCWDDLWRDGHRGVTGGDDEIWHGDDVSKAIRLRLAGC